MPFPPKTKEVDFDYEALLEDNVLWSDTDACLALLTDIDAAKTRTSINNYDQSDCISQR